MRFLFLLISACISLPAFTQGVYERNLSPEKMKQAGIRTATITYPDGSKNLYVYDRDGNPVLAKLFGGPYKAPGDTTYVIYSYTGGLKTGYAMVWARNPKDTVTLESYDHYPNGKLKTTYVYASKKVSKTIANTYDSLGRIASQTETQNGVKQVSEYQYNAAGLLIRIRHIDPKDIAGEYVKTDGNGTVIERYKDEYTCTSEVVYEYTTNKTAERHFGCSDKKVKYECITVYDPKTRTEKETTSGTGDFHMYSEHVFDENGLLIIVSSGRDDKRLTRISYTRW